jgi:hypothetical protein
MPLSDQAVTGLRTFRLSHCATCSCARCRQIDQLLGDMKQRSEPQPEAGEAWLIEGRLLRDEHGHLTIARGDTIASLDEALSNWSGHHLMILIGAREP